MPSEDGVPTVDGCRQAQDEFAFLWEKVVEAREAVEVQRRQSRTSSSWVASADLLSALEHYAASLTRHGRPIPYPLRDELRLRRLTQ